MNSFHGPLDAGQRNHRKCRILRNRRVLMAAFWMVGTAVRLLLFIEKLVRHIN